LEGPFDRLMEFLIGLVFIALQTITIMDFRHQKELEKEAIVVLVVVIFLFPWAYGEILESH